MKNNIWQYLLFLSFSFFGQTVDAQVVFRELLSQDHQGELTQSINYPGKTLAYEWQFIDMEKGQYFAEGEAIQKINYKLQFKIDGKPIGHFDVQIRDLIVTHYIEIKIVNEAEPRTITSLYNKSIRWLRLKGVLHEGCRQDGSHWGRLDGVQNYDELLEFVVLELDKNIKLECYL